MRIDNGQLAGFEALLRWEHPEKGLLYPIDFLPVAAETNLIFQIEDWVLREACKQMLHWRARDPEGASLKMHVNLASRHLEHPSLVGSISRILRETALPPQNLTLDLGESALTESSSSENTLQALRNLGVGLAIDNFGAGYSSLSDLRRFPLDTLKVDRSIVSELHSASEMRELLSAVVCSATLSDSPYPLPASRPLSNSCISGKWAAIRPRATILPSPSRRKPLPPSWPR